MSDNDEALLRAMLATLGRQTFAVDRLADIVLTKTATRKQLVAYNLCNGTMSQSDVAKSAKIDQGNFSRTVTRWIEAGVLFRLGDGRDAKLLHVYPLPDNVLKTR